MQRKPYTRIILTLVPGVLATTIATAGPLDALKKALDDTKDVMDEVRSTVGDVRDSVREGRETRREVELMVDEIQYQDRRSMDPYAIQEMQTLLNELGFNVGTPDGKIGNRTRQGIRQFQSAYGYQSDGLISDSLIQALRQTTRTPQQVLPNDSLTRSEWRLLQGYLNRAGYRVGAADGIPGPKTRRAINDYAAGYQLVNTPREVLTHLVQPPSVTTTTQTGSLTTTQTISTEPAQPVTASQKPVTDQVAASSQPVVNGKATASTPSVLTDRTSVSSTQGPASIDEFPQLTFECGSYEDAFSKSAFTEANVEEQQKILGCLSRKQSYDITHKTFTRILPKLNESEQALLLADQITWQNQALSVCGEDEGCFSGYFSKRNFSLATLANPRNKDGHRAFFAKLSQSQGIQSAKDTRDSRWFGSIACEVRRNATQRDVEFIVEPVDDGLYKARLYVEKPDSLQTGTIVADYIGETVAQTDSGEQINFVIDTKKMRFGSETGAFQFDTGNGKGRFDGGNCSALNVRPMAPDDKRLVPNLPTTPTRGHYWNASDTRARCEVLIGWVDRLKQEYRDRDFYRTTQKGDDWRKIKIFGDVDFIPVFGEPFDQLSEDKLNTIASLATQKCARDPFTAERMQTFDSVAGRTLRLTSQSRSINRYSGVVFAVRKMRILRHDFAAMQVQEGSQLANADEFTALDSRYQALIEAGSQSNDFLWPSEKATIKSQAELKRSEAAAQAAQLYLATLQSNIDPLSGAQASNVDRIIRLPFYQYIPGGAEKRKFADALATAHKNYAQTLTAAPLKAANAAPISLEGLALIRQMPKEQPADMNAFSNTERRAYNKVLEQQKQLRLQQLIDTRRAQIDDFASNREGLMAGAQWIQQFKQSFDHYSDSDEYVAAVEHFSTHREAALESALEEFELATSTASETKAKQLLSEYLSWTGDWELPVALDYEFAAGI